MISLILLACLLTGTPRGVCVAEVSSGAIVEDFQTRVEVPNWATENWIDYVAHIVASEARGVPQADIVVACTILDDILSDPNPAYRAWHLEYRWYGYGPPEAADRQAVRDTLYTDACEDVPDYRYVGNFKDAQYWHWLGMIEDGKVDLYLGAGGQAVIGVP